MATTRRRTPASSRDRYRGFVGDYRAGRLDEQTTNRIAGRREGTPREEPPQLTTSAGALLPIGTATRRQYLREYLRWLWPHRYAAGLVFLLALTAAGLEMAEPLFMRSIIDGVLLNTTLEPAERLRRLHLIGGLFVALVVTLQ